MTRRQRLALVVMDDRDPLGDESILPSDSLLPELTASVLEAMTTRINRLTKRMDRLEKTPEIAAALARMTNREAY